MYNYIRAHNLQDVVIQNGAWKPGPGIVVVYAVHPGIWPSQFQERVHWVAHVRQITDYPDKLFSVIEELGSAQREVEKYEALRGGASEGKGQAAPPAVSRKQGTEAAEGRQGQHPVA